MELELSTDKPGSSEAIANGCECPVMDNNRGRGFLLGGETQFWISGACPLHGLKDEGNTNG